MEDGCNWNKFFCTSKEMKSDNPGASSLITDHYLKLIIDIIEPYNCFDERNWEKDLLRYLTFVVLILWIHHHQNAECKGIQWYARENSINLCCWWCSMKNAANEFIPAQGHKVMKIFILKTILLVGCLLYCFEWCVLKLAKMWSLI